MTIEEVWKMATRLKTVKEVDRLIVTVITDNYYDALRPDTKVSTPFRLKTWISHPR